MSRHFRSHETPGLSGIIREIQKLKDEGHNSIVITRHDGQTHLRSWQMPVHQIVRKYVPGMEVKYRQPPKTIPLPRTF